MKKIKKEKNNYRNNKLNIKKTNRKKEKIETNKNLDFKVFFNMWKKI